MSFPDDARLQDARNSALLKSAFVKSESSPMDFDLTDLRLFDEVLRAGSITGGARAANLSLAAASTRLRELELRAGVALLERHRRGIRPTAAGMAVQDHARRLLAEARGLASVLNEHNRLLRGDLRLVVNTAALYHDLPQCLAGFLRSNDGFDLTISEQPSNLGVAAVASGQADLAIVADYAAAPTLVAREWRVDRLVLVLPRDHPCAGEHSLPFRAVTQDHFVTLAADSALQRHIDERLATGLALRVRARLNNPAQLLQMVACGAGIAILPRVVAVHAPDVAVVALDEPWANRHLRIVWKEGNPRPALEALIGHISGPTELSNRHSAAGMEATQEGAIPATELRAIGTVARPDPPRLPHENTGNPAHPAELREACRPVVTLRQGADGDAPDD